MKAPLTIACHECDLLYELPPLTEGSVAKCSRCGAVLQRHKRDSLNRTLAWTIAGLILFVVANAFPFLDLKKGDLVRQTTLITGVMELYHPWAMMEVFMVGILVSMVKLGKLAKVVPGIAIYSFAILIFVLAAAASSMDPHLIWDRLEIDR
jgi:paraquat-inducible protein A